MEFTTSPTEQTTAVTDLLLAILAGVSAFYLQTIKRANRWKTTLWSVLLVLLTIAALLGALAHGLELSAATRTLIWYPLNLLLGLVIALFVIGVVHDVWGKTSARQVLWPMLGIGVGFFLITLAFPGAFLTFVLYQAVGMLFALGCYGWLAMNNRMYGAWFMTAGVLVTLIASVVQATKTASMTVMIWQLDHNGVYHLIQMASIMLLVAGLHMDLLGPMRKQRQHYVSWGQE